MAVWLLAALLVTLAWHVDGPPIRWGALVILAVLGAVSRIGRRHNVEGPIALSLLSVVLLAAAPLVGPVGAAMIGVLAALPQTLRLPLRAIAFNTGMYAVIGAFGGLVYLAAGGPDPAQVPQALSVILEIGAPLFLADVAQCVANAALVAAVVSVDTGTPFRAQAMRLLTGSGGAYMAYGVIALLLVIVWVPAGVGPLSVLLIFAPFVAARWALTQYGEELQAHERTVGALVAAVEIKSPGSAGQSAAVAELSGWIAEQLSLPNRQVSAARMAGMLHDIGLLLLPTELLAPGRVLAGPEIDLLRSHATRAAELTRGIAFLEPAVPGIVHHHERWDGRGYPAGLTGSNIPMVARIVSVADGFVALTSDRRDRPVLGTLDALEEISVLAGTAYDRAVVQALTRVLRRHSRRTVPEAAPAVLGSAVAHDEPPMRPSRSAAAAAGPLRQPVGGGP